MAPVPSIDWRDCQGYVAEIIGGRDFKDVEDITARHIAKLHATRLNNKIGFDYFTEDDCISRASHGLQALKTQAKAWTLDPENVAKPRYILTPPKKGQSYWKARENSEAPEVADERAKEIGKRAWVEFTSRVAPLIGGLTENPEVRELAEANFVERVEYAAQEAKDFLEAWSEIPAESEVEPSTNGS